MVATPIVLGTIETSHNVVILGISEVILVTSVVVLAVHAKTHRQTLTSITFPNMATTIIVVQRPWYWAKCKMSRATVVANQATSVGAVPITMVGAVKVTKEGTGNRAQRASRVRNSPIW